MADIIEPKILKGFRDFLPAAEIIRRDLTQKIEGSFRSFGLLPIDTPALEYAQILLGKGGGETEKQIYRFKDNGDRDVALRFDLTVPFARFAAMHQADLVFPFKRYHIGKVWRGENTQRGRYREFTQCDFDIIGSDSPAADFEILLMIRSIFAALDVNVHIKFSHRGLFNRFLSHVGQQDNSAEILRAVDKIAKTGIDEAGRALGAIADEEDAKKILDFIAGASAETTFTETLSRMEALSGGPSAESDRLHTIWRYIKDSIGSAADSEFSLDPSITRGLDYYTGVVFETFLTDLPDIGSICSGGRYDNLAGLYTKNAISGVGASVGLDRMIAALEILKKLPASASDSSAAIACIREEDSGLYQALSAQFRQAGISCEVFLECRPLVKQFVLAEKKGYRWIIIPGEKPSSDPFTLRDLNTRQNHEGLQLKEALKYMDSFTPRREDAKELL